MRGTANSVLFSGFGLNQIASTGTWVILLRDERFREFVNKNYTLLRALGMIHLQLTAFFMGKVQNLCYIGKTLILYAFPTSFLKKNIAYLYRLHTVILDRPSSSAATMEVQGPDTT